jgi:hypothetical protein
VDVLPELLERVRALLGEGPMLKLAHEFGGVEIYVPQPERIGADHPLARALGLAGAKRFAQEIACGHVVVPLGPTGNEARCRRAAIEALRAGKSAREAARLSGMTTRGVERLKARLRGAGELGDGQGDLFREAG